MEIGECLDPFCGGKHDNETVTELLNQITTFVEHISNSLNLKNAQ